jgi:hypothetical protein
LIGVQIGLDNGQRRDVQRLLTGLGFDTKVTGKFDDKARACCDQFYLLHHRRVTIRGDRS